eukprot:5784288-Pleurochrysis_carterae.AAC.1
MKRTMSTSLSWAHLQQQVVSALRVRQTCVKLNEQLHVMYDERELADEHERMGALNEQKGKAWALAVRSHTGVFSHLLSCSFP